MFNYEPAEKLADKFPPHVLFDAIKQSFSTRSLIATTLSLIRISLAFLLISLYEISKAAVALTLLLLMAVLSGGRAHDPIGGEVVISFLFALSMSVMNLGLSVLGLIAAPCAMLAFPFTKLVAAFSDEKQTTKKAEKPSSTSVILSHSTPSSDFEPIRQKNIQRSKASLTHPINPNEKIVVDILPVSSPTSLQRRLC